MRLFLSPFDSWRRSNLICVTNSEVGCSDLYVVCGRFMNEHAMLARIFFSQLFLFGLAEIRACFDLKDHFDSSVLIVDFEVV